MMMIWTMAGDLSLAWGLHRDWIFTMIRIDALVWVKPAPHAPTLAGKPDQSLTSLPALGLMVLTGLGVGLYGIWWR